MNSKNKQLYWVILTIILLEGIILFNLNIIESVEKITKVSFFLKNIEAKELLSTYESVIINSYGKDNIDVFVNQKSGHFILTFEVLQNDEKINNFLKNLVESPPKEMHLSELISKTGINFKSAYLIIILFIFIPVFTLWLYLVKHKEIKIHAINYKKLSIYIIIITSVVFLSNYLAGAILGGKLDSDPQDLKKFIQNDTIIAFIFIVIIAPVVEEFLFRGLLFRFFIEKKLVLLGAVLISLEFVLVHYYYLQLNTTIQAKIMLVFGLFILSSSLCWIYYKVNNIFAPIALHSLNNLIGFTLLTMY